ncbi:hypothetical protein HPP92_017679 [Vanilla planifolia]|uniref:Uncharacterized protein n=1 Tax=Vanilla planifolia TaxID=51239 RepID=A0A835Q5M4_VANPL|nr:hypothetical protein HPP92_017679 [Vanilla planifolia]
MDDNAVSGFKYVVLWTSGTCGINIVVEVKCQSYMAEEIRPIPVFDIAVILVRGLLLVQDATLFLSLPAKELVIHRALLSPVTRKKALPMSGVKLPCEKADDCAADLAIIACARIVSQEQHQRERKTRDLN